MLGLKRISDVLTNNLDTVLHDTIMQKYSTHKILLAIYTYKLHNVEGLPVPLLQTSSHINNYYYIVTFKQLMILNCYIFYKLVMHYFLVASG